MNLGSIAAAIIQNFISYFFANGLYAFLTQPQLFQVMLCRTQCSLSRHTVQPQLVLHFIKQTNCHDSNAQCTASASSQMDCFLNCQLFTQVISANVPQQEIQPLNLCNCDLCLFIIHGPVQTNLFGMQKTIVISFGRGAPILSPSFNSTISTNPMADPISSTATPCLNRANFEECSSLLPPQDQPHQQFNPFQNTQQMFWPPLLPQGVGSNPTAITFILLPIFPSSQSPLGTLVLGPSFNPTIPNQPNGNLMPKPSTPTSKHVPHCYPHTINHIRQFND